MSAQEEIGASAVELPPVLLSEDKTVFRILAAISLGHLLNDMVQSLIPAMYPIFKSSFHLDFGQIGLITLTYQITASLLQPFVGLYTDRRPHPHSLSLGMAFTLVGLILLATAPNFGTLLLAGSMVGMGSAVFHPESSRVARLASGGRHGLAQSLFQVGGNAGTALGPLAAAFVVVPRGQRSIAWFSVAALLGMMILSKVGNWYKVHPYRKSRLAKGHSAMHPLLSRNKVVLALIVLVTLIFSKYFYLASISSYYTFYLIRKFHVSVAASQIYLFLFLGAAALGILIGGPIGDRFGRKLVIWCSIVGVLPFTLVLPYANLLWTAILSVVIGLILSSAFTAILVYAQELLPGSIGMVSGVFFGFAFGMGGIGAAVLGELADHTNIYFVYRVCSFLPALGLLTVFLPNLKRAGLDRQARVEKPASRS
jgi:FSR family fosmidomycin resistance protein-like MFS transporter